MNAKELRIGNLLIGKYGVAIISELTFWKAHINNYNGNPLDTILDYSEIKPIPLTEEWLLKFGFIKNTGFYRHPKTMWDYSLIDNELELFSGWDGDTYTVSCKYVHQLQNLYFALTGQELDTI